MAKTWDAFVAMAFAGPVVIIVFLLIEEFTGWTPGGIHLHTGGH